MKKLFFLLLTVFLSTAVQAQLLYKISGNGLQRPSYIVGTYHLAPSTFADSIPGTHTALEQCEQVFGELDIAAMLNPDSLALVQQAMMLPEGMTLSQILSADEMKRVTAYAEKKLTLATPMLMKQAEQMTPMALSTTFEVLNYAMRTGQINQTDGLDLYFQRYALEHGKETGGLETLGFQIKVLYQSKSMERQKQLLLCLADNPDFNDMMTDMVIDNFFAQNLEGVKKAMDMKLEDECDTTPEEEEQLIYGRNADWAIRMPAIMQSKPTLFVVGSAHLPGEKGVLHLLRMAGYDIEAVKKE